MIQNEKEYYTCGLCGKKEELTTPKADMEKELHQNISEDFFAEDCNIVCDDCYKKMGFKDEKISDLKPVEH